MATSDKFIQSMLELIDKIIEHQSKNGNILSEIKSSVTELRSEADSILENLRDKLPDTLSKEQEEIYSRLIDIAAKIEEKNLRLNENIKTFEQNYSILKALIEKSNVTLETNSLILKAINDMISEKEKEKKEIEDTLKDLQGFITALRSKKAWLALLVAGIAAIATAITSVIGSLESVNKFLDKNNNQNYSEKQSNKPKP